MDACFDHAFKVGTAAEIDSWLDSTEEAWFFLDSVDEAQRETPRALENAVRLFGAKIHSALNVRMCLQPVARMRGERCLIKR